MRNRNGKQSLLLTAAIMGLIISASMNNAYAEGLWGTLKEAANATEPASRIYNATENEVITENIGNIGNNNANLIVNMNNNTINGEYPDDVYHSGFVTTAGTQKLTINDATVGNFHNTTGNGSFIYDNYGAEININNSIFMNNEAVNGGVIYSTGKLNLTDTTFYFNKGTGLGGAIYSKGDVTVNAVNKAVGLGGNAYGPLGEDENAIYKWFAYMEYLIYQGKNQW